jgi:hypothetical protein
MGENVCSLCRRSAPKLTRHHLVPQSRARKSKRRQKRAKKGLASTEAAAAELDQTVNLCRDCHEMVHAVLCERELEREYSSLAALRNHPQIAAFVRFVARQDPGRRVPVRWSKRRREAS